MRNLTLLLLMVALDVFASQIVESITLERPMLLERFEGAQQASIFVEFGRPGVGSQNIFKDGCTITYSKYIFRGTHSVIPTGVEIPIQQDQVYSKHGWKNIQRRQLSMLEKDPSGKMKRSFSIRCRSSDPLAQLDIEKIRHHLSGIVRLRLRDSDTAKKGSSLSMSGVN